MDLSVENGPAQPLSLSVVIPIYNEEAILPELYRRLTHVLSQEGMGLAYEIVFVNDGSTDNCMEILTALRADDSTIKVINLSRNFGHQAAITAGLDYAKGEVVICMDGDLQDPPEVLPTLIEKWREGNDVVYAVRKERKEGVIKRACYSAFYHLLDKLSNRESLSGFSLDGWEPRRSLCCRCRFVPFRRRLEAGKDLVYELLVTFHLEFCAIPYDPHLDS